MHDSLTAECIAAKVAHLIAARNFIDININSETIARSEVSQLQALIRKIDRKIIDLLLSEDFEKYEL